MENQFWAVAWAGLWEKRVWVNYEQLLRPVFSHFRGQKKNLKIVWKHYSVRTEKLHNTFFTIFLFLFFNPKKWKKNNFFRAKIWVEFECKHMKVGNRLLLAILCYVGRQVITHKLDHRKKLRTQPRWSENWFLELFSLQPTAKKLEIPHMI